MKTNFKQSPKELPNSSTLTLLKIRLQTYYRIRHFMSPNSFKIRKELLLLTYFYNSIKTYLFFSKDLKPVAKENFSTFILISARKKLLQYIHPIKVLSKELFLKETNTKALKRIYLHPYTLDDKKKVSKTNEELNNFLINDLILNISIKQKYFYLLDPTKESFTYKKFGHYLKGILTRP